MTALILAAILAPPDVQELAKRAMDRPAVVATLDPSALAAGFEEAAMSGVGAVAIQARPDAKGALRLLAWGGSGEGEAPIQQLTDLARGQLPVFVELRGGKDPERRLFQHMLENALLRQVGVVAPDAERLIAVKRISRRVFTVWSVSGTINPSRRERLFIEWERTRSDSIALPAPTIDQPLAAEARRLKIPLMALGVIRGDVARLRSLRVSFLVTSDPRGVLAELR